MHTGAIVGTGFTVLVINNESGSMIRLNDVAFGEVWVCSGQSNMEWTIIGVRHALQVKYTLSWENYSTLNLLTFIGN